MVNNKRRSSILSDLGIIINLIALLVAVFGQILDPQTGIILGIALLIFIALYFVVSYVIRNLLDKINQINDNNNQISDDKKDLNNLKDNVDMIMNVAKLGARVSNLEEKLPKMKNKRGQIDPRGVIILIIFYLRSKGLF